MAHYTKDDILRMVEEDDVEFIRLQFTDVFGTLKNVAVTASQIERVLDYGCMFDGASIKGFAGVENSDMYLVPDMDTFEIFPWRPQQGKVARLICDVYTLDGKPFEGDPRYILKKVIKEAEEMGYTLDVGPELEFFLFHTDDDGMPTTLAHEKGGYFDIGPIDLGENARRDMVMTLEEMGYEIEASHHEMAPAQHEIDFRYADVLRTADNIVTFKMVVRSIAKRHGLHASFMPKPVFGVSGSGMHINLSLNDADGFNIFGNPQDPKGLSKVAYHFMAGVLNHANGLSLIANPLINSYKRLVPDYEAPVYVAWSTSNRSALLRVPATRGTGKRIELRSPDPSANPYLLLASCLAAGLEGIRNQEMPKDPVSGNIFAMPEADMNAMGISKLPSTLKEAVDAFNQDPFLQTVLGPHISDTYVKSKSDEWEAYRKQITQWEIDQYLYRI